VQRGVAEPAILIIAAPVGGQISANRRVGDAGQAGYISAECFYRVAHQIGMVYDEHMVAVETDGPAADIAELAIDDDRADDESDGDEELENDQAAAEPAASEAGCDLSFKHVYRLEGREIKSRVTAGQAAHDDHQRYQHREQAPGEQGGRMELLTCQIVEQGQQGGGDTQRQQQREQAQQDGLGEKLGDEVSLGGTGHLSDAYLFGAIGRAGRAEIHEIDAGDHQYEYGDEREHIYIGDIPIGLHLVGFVGMQMDVGQGHELVFEIIPRVRQFP